MPRLLAPLGVSLALLAPLALISFAACSSSTTPGGTGDDHDTIVANVVIVIIATRWKEQ